MLPGFKPLRGVAIGEEDLDFLPYPLFGFTKYNGYRAIWLKDEGIHTKSMRPYPNKFLAEEFRKMEFPFHMMDGELMTGTKLSDCTSAFMSHYGEPTYTYWVFDAFSKETNYASAFEHRLAQLHAYLPTMPNVKVAPYQVLANASEAKGFMNSVVNNPDPTLPATYREGIILRSFDGVYKYGKSTLKQGLMYKWKVWTEDEAVVIDYQFLEKNENAAYISPDGYQKRHQFQAGMVEQEMIGKLIVKNEYGVFSIGGGPDVTHELRRKWYDDRDTLIGRIVRYKFQKDICHVVPAAAQFLDWRPIHDLDPDDPVIAIAKEVKP